MHTVSQHTEIVAVAVLPATMQMVQEVTNEICLTK